VAKLEGDGWLSWREMGCYVGGIWVVRLVAHLLAKAAFMIRIQTSRKNTKWAT
jgi:hypothetical protein